MFFLYKKYSILNLLRKYVLKRVKKSFKKDSKEVLGFLKTLLNNPPKKLKFYSKIPISFSQKKCLNFLRKIKIHTFLY